MKNKDLPAWCQFTRSNNPIDLKLPDAPPWRNKNLNFNSYIPLKDKEIKMVNAALLLRRPLLITGKPGSGKSSLAEAVRKNLNLGEKVLNWRITSQSNFIDGLYSYDALSRLQDIQFNEIDKNGEKISKKIENYLKLEALGTAFASKKQRVVLIDEIDKSHIDLPNNLLHLFEENEFEIPELKRLNNYIFKPFSDTENYHEIENGLVKCDINTFPLIIMTSNGERDFSSAFMRRCLHLEMTLPDPDELAMIVNRHFEAVGTLVDQNKLKKIIKLFHTLRDQDENRHYISTDQLLNAVYLMQEKNIDLDAENIQDGIWKNLLG